MARDRFQHRHRHQRAAFGDDADRKYQGFPPRDDVQEASFALEDDEPGPVDAAAEHAGGDPAAGAAVRAAALGGDAWGGRARDDAAVAGWYEEGHQVPPLPRPRSAGVC